MMIDSETVSWLNSIKDAMNGFPDYLVRFSWKTMQNILEKRLGIKW